MRYSERPQLSVLLHVWNHSRMNITNYNDEHSNYNIELLLIYDMWILFYSSVTDLIAMQGLTALGDSYTNINT